MLGVKKYLSSNKCGTEAIILNIASVVVADILPSVPAYTGTKGAVVYFTKCFGTPHYYDDNKVRVIAVGPGVVLTEYVKGLISASTLGAESGSAEISSWIPQR